MLTLMAGIMKAAQGLMIFKVVETESGKYCLTLCRKARSLSFDVEWDEDMDIDDCELLLADG